MVYFRTPSLQPAVYYTTEASPSSSPGIACVNGGGQWQLDLPSGCGDNCGTQGAVCTAGVGMLALSNGCNCGDAKCWNESTQTCIAGTSAMDGATSPSPSSPACITEGNSGGLGDSCCPGLITSPGTLSGDECLPGMGTFSCTKCGNGVCAAGENWCNCSVDCPLPTTSPSPSPSLNPSLSPSPSPSPVITSMNIPFSVRLKGVINGGVSNQPLYLRIINSSNKSIVFNPVVIWQNSSDPSLFKGTLSLDTSFIGTGWTVIIKGPVHLQRRFDNMTIVKNTELNLTGKPLLSGDLQLPQSGQNDIVDYDDRDYLWSLVSLTGRSANSAEIRAADLDLNNKVDNRDYSLLIDTGIGVGGEH